MRGKSIKNITGDLLLFWAGIILVLVNFLALLFASPFVQNALAKSVANYFSDVLETEVKIDKLHLFFFDEFHLHGVLIKDREGDTLFYTGTLDVELSKRDLLRKTLRLEYVETGGLNALIKVDSNGKYNYQFLADVFAGQASDSGKNLWKFLCDDFVLENGKFRYVKYPVKKADSSKGINYNDICADSLFLDASDIALVEDTLTAVVDLLRFNEKSGFVLDDFSTNLRLYSGHISGETTKIIIGETQVDADVEMQYDSPGAFGHFVDSVKMKVFFHPSVINLKDLGYFAPVLFQMDNTIDLTALVTGTVSNFKARQMSFSLNGKTHFKGQLKMRGLPDFEDTFIRLRIRDFQSSVSHLAKINIPTETGRIILPEFIKKIGNFRVKGNFTGFYNDFVSFAEYVTDAGFFSTDIKVGIDEKNILHYDGYLQGKNVEAGLLTGLEDRVEKLDFNLRLKGHHTRFEQMEVLTEGMVENIQISGNNIQNIELKGLLKQKKYTGNINVKDEIIDFDFDGILDFSEQVPRYDFVADIRLINLKAFRLFPADSFAVLTTKMDINARGSRVEDIQGNLLLSNTRLAKNKEVFNIGNTYLVISKDAGQNRGVKLYSPLVDLTLDGKIDVRRLVPDFLRTLNKYAAKAFPVNETSAVVNRQDFVFDFHIKNPDVITKIFFDFPLPSSGIKGNGEYANYLNYFSFNAGCDYLSYYGKVLKNSKLEMASGSNGLSAGFYAATFLLSDTMRVDNIFYNSLLNQDTLDYHLTWNSSKAWSRDRGNIAGWLYLDTTYYINRFQPSSEIVLFGNKWTVSPENEIVVDSAGVHFHHLNFTTGKETLKIAGGLADNDTLLIAMQRLKVKNFENFYRQYNLDFGGTVNGALHFIRLDSAYKVLANISVDSMAFNGIYLGDAYLSSIWKEEEQAMKVGAGIVWKGNVGKKEIFSVSGSYYPFSARQNYDLYIKLDNFKLKSLQPMVGAFSHSLRGLATGNLHLTGKSNQPLLLGSVRLKRVALGIEYLNTEYYFADKVSFDTNYIHMDSVKITDAENNHAIINGSFRHRFFNDMKYRIDVSTEKILGLNTGPADNEYFYGKAFVAGDVDIKGDLDKVDILLDIAPQKNTKITLPIDYSTDLAENDFIVFVSHDDTVQQVETIKQQQVEESSSLTVDARLGVTEDAELELIMPFDMGNITAKGNGDLEIIYDEQGDLSMTGEYKISSGKYDMNIQGVLRKEFSLLTGSNILWNGDPYDAKINIRAAYELRTKLGEYAPAGDTSTVVPVQCLITLKNRLSEPEIYFGIDFPGMSEDVKQIIFSRLDTTNQALMMRQVISLLVVNSFNYSSGMTSSLQSSGIAFVTGQINNWLRTLSDDFDLGIHYKPGDNITEDELGIMLSTQLWNDRIRVKGNFGVRNEAAEGAGDHFIGEGEVEIKLTKDGRLRLKAFNRSNNDYLFQDYSRYTQGVGIYYSREFDKLSELLGKKGN